MRDRRPGAIVRGGTVRRVGLVNGNLILDQPVPSRLLDDLEKDRRLDGDSTHLRYSAITCDPDDFAIQGYSLRQASSGKRIELAIIITMYNEEDELFSRTMHGLMRNIQYLCTRNPATHLEADTWGLEGWKKVVICIVSDGRDHISPRVLNILSTLGLYQEGLMKEEVNGKEVQAHLFEYTTQLSMDPKGVLHTHDTGIRPCQMIFCLKERNKKKINSHRWFFRAFAPQLDPRVTVLIDVGTRPGDRSLHALWSAFIRDDRLGGACGEVGVMKGFGWRLLLNPLVATQFFEYKMSNILDKPFESTLGYIMVLPGAFSAYRWKALQDDADGRGPLASYFKGELRHGDGKGSRGIFEANMYLAEDRILCFELVAKRGKEGWVLRYVRSAYAETDVPASVAEFIVQRRRWLNGSFFAAVYALLHWGRIFGRRHTILRNVGFVIQFIYTLFNVLFSWVAIGNFYLTFYFLAATMTNPSVDPIPNGIGPILFHALQYAYAIILVMMFICCLGNRPQGSKAIIIISMTLFALLMAYMLFASGYLTYRGITLLIDQQNQGGGESTMSLLLGNSTFRDIILALGSTFGVYLLISLLYLQPWHMLTSFLQYMLMIPSFVNILQVYAFCNTHDVSWGTKEGAPRKSGGLVDVAVSAGAMEEKAVHVALPDDPMGLNDVYLRARREAGEAHRHLTPKRTDEQRQEDYYRLFRTWLVLAWILSNALLVIIISSTQVADLLTSNLPAGSIGDKDQSGGMNLYVTNRYFSFVLWSVAGLALVRFVGSFIYLLQWVFLKGY